MATQFKGTTLQEPLLSFVKELDETFQARPSDIVLSSYPKCGSTWIKSLAYSIVHYSDDKDPLESADFIHGAIRTIDFAARGPDGSVRGPSVADGEPCRLYHCHLPYRAVPTSIKRQRCKVIYCARNAKSMIVSGARFFQLIAKHGVFLIESLRELGADGSLEAFVDGTAASIVEGREMYGPFVRHVLDAWEASKASSDGVENPVLFLQYEELLSDYEAQVGVFVCCCCCQFYLFRSAEPYMLILCMCCNNYKLCMYVCMFDYKLCMCCDYKLKICNFERLEN